MNSSIPHYGKALAWLLALALPVFYLLHPASDFIGGLWGIFWEDEGGYLLSAKHTVLYGTPHLFEGDLWRPELLSPLLHQMAIWFLSAQDTVSGIRLAAGVHVLLGGILLAHLYYRRTGNLYESLACFAVILLNPILYFYGRIGLAEGFQFLLLALLLLTMHGMIEGRNARRLYIASGLCGLLLVLLAVSKISAAPACAALGLTALLGLHWSPAKGQKLPALILLAVGGIIALLLFFGIFLGDQLPEWWRANFLEVSRRSPESPWTALLIARVKLSDIAYYFTLMPIFVLYFCCLFVAAGERGFPKLLAVATLLVMLIESFFGGDIRRNFFSLAMLSVTAGFSVHHYVRHGVRTLWPLRGFRLFAAIMLLLHLWGVLFLLYFVQEYDDMIYTILCCVFLLLAVLMCLARGTAYYKARLLIIGLLVICSLVPMSYQAFFAPYTRESFSRSIEEAVPEDAVITGAAAPWMMVSVKRRIVLTNCIWGNANVNFGNSWENVPLHSDYYLSTVLERKDEHCAPPAFEQYNEIGRGKLLTFYNFGGRAASSDYWAYFKTVVLYGR